MAANLVELTVKQYGSQTPNQDGVDNKWLFVKSRFLNTKANGADCQIQYAERLDTQANVNDVLVDEAYSTVRSALTGANQYSAGKQFEVTVVGVDFASVTPELQTLLVDQIMYVKNDPNAVGINTNIFYLNPLNMQPTILTVTGNLAAIISATTT
jgi:hypothetical protein